MDFQLKKKPWYFKYRYYLIAGILFLAFTIYVLFLAFGPRRLMVSEEDYKTGDAKMTQFVEYIDVEGLVQPIQTIQVNALESGFVARIVAEEGSMVKAGDTILVLSNPELLRSIDDEQMEWANSQRNYREQEIEMKQRNITLRQQALEASHQMSSLDKSLKQSREEYRMGVKSRTELDVAEEDYHYQRRKAQLQMQSLHHDSVATLLKREMMKAGQVAANKKLSRSAQRTSNLVVRATVDGQVSFLNVTIGQQIAAGSSVGQIKVMKAYKVHTAISEYYIDRITMGLPASIQYQNNKFPLRISKVVPEVKEHSFDCDLVFTGAKPTNIRLGKTYRVQVELDKADRVLVIPRGDFYANTGGEWIYRLSADGKKARKVKIEIGRQNPEQYEIKSGLKPGDHVIVTGYDKLGDSEEIALVK